MGLQVSPMVEPIPDDGLLLHIGVFKTGTTALQETLRYSTETLSANGILYRGPASWKWSPLRELASTGGSVWRSLVDDVAAHRGRVVVSSENLCGCDDDEAAHILQQLGGDRPVRILLTVRGIAELLPSTWQQFLKRRMSQPFDEWVAEVLAHSETGEGVFWRRNDFPRQVRRWGSLVGAGQVTVVVSEKSEPDRLLRLTEQFLSLPSNDLQFHPTGKTNRSLSRNAAELLRRVNQETADLIDGDEYRRLVRLGVFPAIHKVDQPGIAPILLAPAAAEKASAIGARQAEELRLSGAHVVGDLSVLARAADMNSSLGESATDIPLDLATAGIVGALGAKSRDTGSKGRFQSQFSANRVRRFFQRR